MPFVPVPNVAQVRFQGVVDNQLTINDQYWEIAGGGITPTNLFSLVASLAAWWSGQVVPLLSDDWSTSRVVGVDLTSATGPVAEQSVAATGGEATEAAPNNVAACVSFRTAQRGRSARGRNYVPGIPNSKITLNTLDATFITNLIAAYALLPGAGAFIAGWSWVIVSRFSGGVARVSPLIIPVESVTMVGNSVRSMRSREIGHGA